MPKVVRLTATEEVLEILRNAHIDDTGVDLRCGKLAPTTYKNVDKFLTTAGCKWNRSAQRHLFVDPQAKSKLLELLETGQVVNHKQTLQQFFTPAELRGEMVGLAGIGRGYKVLEPSAGDGALADAAVRAGADLVICYEIDPLLVEQIRAKGHTVFLQDFLRASGLQTFDAVVMNPPFTGGQDIAHVTHAYRSFLKPGGRLVAIVAGGALDSSARSKAKRAFNLLVATYGVYHRQLPAGTFSGSGTQVITTLLVLQKPEADE